MEEVEIFPDFILSDTIGEISDRSSIVKYSDNTAMVSIHNQLNIYDVRKGCSILSLCDEKPGRITCFDATDDSTLFCVGYETGVIKIFENGKKTKQFRPHSKRVTDLKIIENTIISSSADGSLIKYDMFDEEIKMFYKGTKVAIYNFKIRDGMIITNSGDNVIRHWNIDGEMCMGIVPCDNEVLDFIYFENFFVIFYCNGQSCIFDSINSVWKRGNVFKKIKCVKIHEDRIYVLGKGKLVVYKISIKHSKKELPAKEDLNSENKVFSQSDKNQVLNNEKIKRLNITEDKNLCDIEKNCINDVITKELILQSVGSYKTDVNYHSFDVKNTDEVVFVSKRNKIVSLNLREGQQYKISFHESEIFEVLFFNKKVVTFSEEKYIVWKICDDKVEKMHSCELDFIATNARKFGAHILVSSPDAIHFYDLKNNKLLKMINLPNKIIHLNRNTLFVGFETNLEIFTIDYESFGIKSIKKTKFYEDITYINSSGSQLYYGISFLDNTLQIFDFLHHESINTLFGHALPIRYFTFSPSSDTILTCGADKLVKLWGTEFGECRKSFVGDAINACYINRQGFLFCDDKLKYYKKHACIRQYKGYNQRIVSYSDQMLVVVQKYGLKYFKTGLYEIDENLNDSDEIEDEILREHKITDYKLYERLINELNEIEMEEKTDLKDLFKLLKFVNLAEIDKIIYFLTESHVRIILRCLKEYYLLFPVNAMRIFINIGRIYSYVCKNNRNAYELFKVLNNHLDVMREEIGVNMMDITLM